MRKLKILHLQNNIDSMWFKLEPDIETLNYLDSIFNIFELIPAGNKNISRKNLKSWIKHNQTDFFIDEEKCLAYIIITERYIHIILKKVGNYKSVMDTIMDYFEFNLEKSKNVEKSK